jgi:hypothetical protein
MNFKIAKSFLCARALLLIASLWLVVNCHKPEPQLGNKDAFVNANTDNSNSNQNARAVTAEVPASEQTPRPGASLPRPHVSATPTPPQKFASRDSDEKTGVVEDAISDSARRRAIQSERAAQQERTTRRAIRARPKQAATP